jgi:signal transduction histidine kinase
VTAQAPALEPARGAALPDVRELTPLLLGAGAVAFFLLGILGRSTIKEGEVLSLVWPAAGASVLLFGLSSTRRWWLVSVLVAVATVALNLVTGATGTQSGIFVVANLAQAMSAVLILRALAPSLQGVGGARPLDQLRDFWPVVAASTGGALVGATLGSLGRGVLLDSWSGADFAVWWGRNAVGCVVVVTTALLVLEAWPRWRSPSERALLATTARTRLPEVLLLAAASVALYLSAFELVSNTRPVAFPLLLPTVWVGLRFRALPAAVHSLLVCTAVVLFTLHGRGPFAGAGGWNRQVLVSQLFIGLAFSLGTLLAMGRAERLSLTGTISEARTASESQARLLSTIIEAMHDGVSLVDESGQVVLRNTAGAQLARHEIGATNHVSESGFTMATPDGRELAPEEYPWARAFAGVPLVEQDMVLVFDDGSPSRTLAMTAHLLPHRDDGQLDQALVIYHDVTTDRAQRTALESFAGVAAHDLSGPLGVIEGWTEMLQLDLDAQGSLTREQAAPKLERIRVTVNGMRQLVSDLLDSSTSRDQKLRTVVVDLDAEARAIAEQRVEMSTGEPPRIEVAPLPPVYADAGMVRQLLGNLVSNAVKYVAPGEVAHVSISAREVKGRIEVTVADEGIGIPASQRDRIFDAFERADTAAGYEGHGIGLSVCKTIVERHGGMIVARPPLGELGTRIVFTLPVVPPQLSATPETSI